MTASVATLTWTEQADLDDPHEAHCYGELPLRFGG